jgi:hypothetical protein
VLLTNCFVANIESISAAISSVKLDFEGNLTDGGNDD